MQQKTPSAKIEAAVDSIEWPAELAELPLILAVQDGPASTCYGRHITRPDLWLLVVGLLRFAVDLALTDGGPLLAAACLSEALAQIMPLLESEPPPPEGTSPN